MIPIELIQDFVVLWVVLSDIYVHTHGLTNINISLNRLYILSI